MTTDNTSLPCTNPCTKITDEMVDEFMECLWIMEERGGTDKRSSAALCGMAVEEGAADNSVSARAVLSQVEKDGFVIFKGEEIEFTQAGRDRARNIIRRKRLAEKLLAEVLSVDAGEIRSTACRFEHILSPEVTNSVCSFLGHPPTCPHGKPIPHGECCKKLSHFVKPLVMPMTDLDPGSRGRIVFIAPKDHSRMDRLSSLGIVPGTEVSLHQKKPAFVIRIGESELALDTDIAGEIYVKEIR